MEIVITIIGAFASITGASIAWKQAREAKSAADHAKDVRKQLIAQRKTSELAELRAANRNATQTMAKYGPASPVENLIGVQVANDANVIQEYVVLVGEHRAYFGTKSPNAADNHCSALRELLQQLADTKEMADQKSTGKQLFIAISTFSATIKRVHDTGREKAVV